MHIAACVGGELNEISPQRGCGIFLGDRTSPSLKHNEPLSQVEQRAELLATVICAVRNSDFCKIKPLC